MFEQKTIADVWNGLIADKTSASDHKMETGIPYHFVSLYCPCINCDNTFGEHTFMAYGGPYATCPNSNLIGFVPKNEYTICGHCGDIAMNHIQSHGMKCKHTDIYFIPVIATQKDFSFGTYLPKIKATIKASNESESNKSEENKTMGINYSVNTAPNGIYYSKVNESGAYNDEYAFDFIITVFNNEINMYWAAINTLDDIKISALFKTCKKADIDGYILFPFKQKSLIPGKAYWMHDKYAKKKYWYVPDVDGINGRCIHSTDNGCEWAYTVAYLSGENESHLNYWFEPMQDKEAKPKTYLKVFSESNVFGQSQKMTPYKYAYEYGNKTQERELRTQKAKGIRALKNNVTYSVPDFQVYAIEDVIKNGEIQESIAEKLVHRFVRPCPVNPRHGFVDSRPIRSLEAAQEIVRETIAADEQAELLSMPFVEAAMSGIWTDGRLVLGSSNDGATAGHHCYSIPTLGVLGDHEWTAALREAGITEAPYVEMLWEEKKFYSSRMETDVMGYKNYLVQLRNGPKLPNTLNYIPEDFEVKNVFVARVESENSNGARIVNADGSELDLLAWETDVKNLPAGTVVYHPHGSLASHVAVHAVLNQVPVCVTFEPKVGETLKQESIKAESNIEKMRIGFYLGATADMDYETASFAMLSACHSTSVWLGNQDLLLGFGMGAAYRLTITAALGEFRHKPHTDDKPTKMEQNRKIVYRNAWNQVLTPAYRQKFLKAIKSFGEDYWPGSFGGQKWYEFSCFACEVYNALLKKDAKLALEKFNQLVHAAHNGGWAFNKFVREQDLNTAAKNPVRVILKAAPKLYEALVKADSEIPDWFRYRTTFKLDETKTRWHMYSKKVEEKKEAKKNIEVIAMQVKPYKLANEFNAKFQFKNANGTAHSHKIQITEKEFTQLEQMYDDSISMGESVNSLLGSTVQYIPMKKSLLSSGKYWMCGTSVTNNLYVYEKIENQDIWWNQTIAIDLPKADSQKAGN